MPNYWSGRQRLILEYGSYPPNHDEFQGLTALHVRRRDRGSDQNLVWFYRIGDWWRVEIGHHGNTEKFGYTIHDRTIHDILACHPETPTS